MNSQTRKRKCQDTFDKIDDHYSKKWHSVNDKDDEYVKYFSVYSCGNWNC